MAKWAYLAGMFITWLSQPKILQHLNDPCPKNIMNLGIKNEPVTIGPDVCMVSVPDMFVCKQKQDHTYVIAPSPGVTNSVMLRFR